VSSEHLGQWKDCISLFWLKTERAWVIWTQKGYHYNVSPEGEELNGWDIDRGKNKEATFICFRKVLGVLR